MDEYDKKFAEMQKYIPFLEAMIERLQNVKDKSREVQLQKMQSLHGILSNSKRKLKIETLQRCEDVLQKLHNKVEKGNTPGLHFPKRSDPSSAQPSTAAEDTASEQSKPARLHQPEDGSEEKAVHETPASPSPPVSPDSVSLVAPIIIPTERSADFIDTSKPASPDPVETLPTKAPIIIPTERTSKNADDITFSEWEMLEESENQAARSKTWQSIVTSGHDVSAAIKMVGSNLPQKDSRSHVPIPITSSRHIPTVPVPSLGGSRRLSSVLEKGRMLGVSLEPPDARPESPVNVPDVRLKSPDPEILYPKHKNTSPRMKEAVQRPAATKPSAPLLLSPPPVSAEPPLSMEDLAELLNEEGEGKAEKKSEKVRDEAGKFKKLEPSKDAKASKPYVLTQEDIDSESERRWEEIDKHIVKMTSRKCIIPAKAEAPKVSEAKGPGSLIHGSSSCPVNVEKVVDRNRPPSPGSKMEPRYADNYERHPRQLRDGHSRLPDESMPSSVPMHHSGPIMPEERNPLMYPRRQGNVAPEIVPPRIDTECRMEGPEYFNRQIPPNQSHWTPINDFGGNQWPPPSTFNAMPNSPAQPYPHPMAMHQEMWNVGPPREPILMDPHQASDGQIRPGQFPANINPGIRPLMSPTARPQDIAHIPRPEEMPNIDVPSVPTIQPLISPTRYPVGPQYRNFQGENRPYDANFDRTIEYSHQRQSWDSPGNRPTDVPYRPENEVPCVPAEVPQAPYTRPSTPCPWSRDRDRGGGRGRSGYYNERSRGEPRNSFNRDARRPEWARESHEWDTCNRFGRDTRNVSDRDPRVRTEHPPVIQSPSQPRDNGAASVRDPRLAKDKHFPAAKGKETSFNERGPRKRTAAPQFSPSFRKAKEKLKSPPKPSESHRRSDTEKQAQEKSPKDKMQSPLESLYGVIDTKAKSAQGYCLQNFKIPKIKRNEFLESPTSSHSLDEGKAAEPVEKQDERASKKGRDKDDATAEVSSSSDGNILFEDWNEGGGLVDNRKEEAKEEEETPIEHVEEKNDTCLGELDLISTTSSKAPEDTETSKKEDVEPEGSKPKEEVTQEWIEALIRKSFEHGEGKKFVEQAKFMQKLGEVLQAKKLKKIKKIIESESESSSSDKDDTFETKKIQMRKKRRVIVSDSSDEESLAERLGILASSAKGSTQEPSPNDQKIDASKNAEETTSSIESSDITVSKSDGTQRAQSIAEEEEPKGEEANVEAPETAEGKNESKNEEQVEDKDNASSKAPKAKARRRNSLEMLQEDIREMFISDDVVAATGHRLCRTQKESQQNVCASTSNQGTPSAKKDEPSKRDAEASSDVEEPLVALSKPKKASKESSKSRGKCKKEAQRVTRQRSKQYNQSSDSEEDQPLALRTELALNSGTLSSRDSCNDETEMLRRSKRIINKETVKEPRVLVEKTDISKLDCSRVMFDSSSDESFGIDVSELAAAVDISLHPDKLSEPEVEPPAKRKSSQSSSKKATKKKELASEGKGDDGFLSDEESIISDISMSSSVASSKKAGFGLPKLDSSANEELLSNILVGLVPSKSDLEKDTSMADKGSDADIDDDASELPVEPSIRKSSAKKKKKKCSWQMGILSKKKRKKAITSSSSPKGDSDALNISSELNTSAKMDDSSVTDEKAVDGTEKRKGSLEDLDASLSNQKLDNSLLLDDSADSKENITASLNEEPLEVKDLICTEAISNDGESKSAKSKELDRSFYDLDINTLIDYAWTGQEKYKCLLCFFTGKNIVHHYKLSHPGKEILISRLKTADAQSAIQDAKDNDVENASLKPLTEQTCKFTCRVCPFFTEGAAKVAMEAFYEHCTTHTGEYRFRCNCCPYQAVAKSSMRTHYYKVCRKLKDTFNESITEDEIPDENRIYGYLCSRCNYIQLKKRNVEDHIQLWHQDNSKASVIKVNMSIEFVKLAPAEVLISEMVKVEEPLLSTEKLEGPVIDTVVSVKQGDDASEIKPVKSSKVCDEEKKVFVVEDGLAKEEEPVEVRSDNEEKKKPPQADGDSSLPAGNNLSVFVCPPELEKKEVEIQLERKRKMQEIIQNIGIKLQKDTSKKGLSIIDKLKDKMKTNIVATGSENDSIVVPDSSSKVASNLATPLDSTTTTTVPAVHDSKINLSVQQVPEEDKQSEDPVAITALSSKEGESETMSEADQSESKVRDPLATLDQKKDESDVENSDTENTRTSAPVYESDSSSELSDTEPPTDVNMILQETSNINASSKDPMLTTIQRLAAQLQATKPLEACKEEEASKPAKPTETLSFLGSIPKPPDVVPISSIKRFIGKLQNRFHEISPDMHEDADAPKNFIRLRRLSGDMLSVTPPSVQEDLLATNDGNEASTLGAMTSVLKVDEEEECSFLKIENVVSLAPRADINATESPIIHDIRKAVETSPMKSKGVSVLKKSKSPLILKRLNTVTITQPLTKTIQAAQSGTSDTVKLIPMKSLPASPVSVTTAQLTTNYIPIAPKSKIIQVDNKTLSVPLSVSKSTVVTPVTTRTVTVGGSPQLSNLNYKILKVVRTPTILKPRDTLTPVGAIKLKSADAYKAMLKTTKLTHLYKCMGRECRFTTDTLEQYQQHYLQHASEAEKLKLSPPYDFQNCAYCYMVLKDWSEMKLHIEDKHTHCRYQCCYCFYRGIAPSYVLMHQSMCHSGHHGILLGKMLKEVPMKEEINRHDYVQPYICQHDCGKFFYVPESFMGHLKAKHGSLLSAFKCHMCRVTCAKIEQLITHYKTHGFHKYQCLYCLSGSDSFNDMHVHLSTFHCNRLPRILERSLPPQPVRNKDVIDQLVIRILDDNFKFSEETIDRDAKSSKEPVAVDTVDTPPLDDASYSQLPKDVNMLNKEENEALNKSLSSLFGGSNNQATSSKSSSENAASEPADKSTIPSDRNSVDPLEVSVGSFDCTDEFINMNLLDNPDFLKNISSHSSDAYFPNNTAASDSKAEDSDIEIVDIVDTGSTTIRDIKYMPDSSKKDSPSANETAEAPSQEADTKEQSYSDVENSSASTDTNGTSSSSATKADKPLTLEDIKDSGLIGTKLYKCGYEGCDQSAQSAVLLRSHVKECSLGGDSKNLNCAHCSKRFMKVGFLLEHLKFHGLKRFGCSLCKMRCTVGYQAMAHMKTKHKAPNSKLVPADPKNPSVDGLFVVHPLRQGGERRGKKRKSTKSLEKESEKLVTDNEKLSFSPDEIESLPRQAIYNREVQCAVCPYTTKVRTNIIRHLLLHAKDEKVPESGPVNPVPCLDKKERMFDKMVNLASSSHQNGRMGGKVKEPSKDNDDEFIPKFVPEHKRYVCGVAECNYLTVDEAMLRCHLKALHSEEQYFRCPHCPQPSPEGLNIAIDKMGVHLKMHDTRLYKCSHCNHHHYHRHVVERHLSDKHSEKRPFVKVIRELENTENSQSVQEEVEEEVPDPDGNHWKCNICEHKCVYKAEMANHATTAHDEKCQYKCTLCPFKTSGKIMFEQHINSKHHNDPNVDYIMVYQRIKGVNKRTVDNVEQGGQEEPFDTTPLWRRDMPRIRHIRGILLEEDEASSESSKPGKRKSDVELASAKPAKIKPGKSNSLDDAKQAKEKSKRLSSCEKVPGDSENSNESPAVAEKAKETKFKTIEDNDFNDSDVGRFGPYGKPDGNMYVCTLCTQFKTKYKHDMRDHLYRELNYARWHCKECGYLSVNRNALLKHFTKRHNGERPNHEPLTPDDDIEEWVGTLLKRQTLMIKGLLSKQSTSNTDTSAVTSGSGTSAKASPVKAAQNTWSKAAKAASLSNKPLNPQDSKVPDTLIDLDALDDSSKDNEGLAEAKDEVPVKKERLKNTAQSNKPGAEGDREKTLICKHCNMAFTRWRGFKLHVQLTHLKRLGFVCPHCDRSTNSESLMLQHIRSKHPGCPEELVQNPAAGGPELTDEFWQKEYGLVFPKRSKKRKRKLSEEEETADDTSEQPESEVKCNLCSFTSSDLTGLKEHMKVHSSSGTLNCSYCTFVSSTKTEYWEHWERNHPFTPFTFDEASAAESPNEPGSAQADKRVIIDDYSDDIEEEHVSDMRDDELIYCCFYCSFRNKALDAVQRHWSSTHKESKPTDTVKSKSSCPFRYKEMHVAADTVPMKAQSSKTEESPYELYLQRSQGDVQEVESHGAKQDGWICQWCNELCDSEVKMKTHHSMFHSHLPLNFKKRDKNKPARGYVCPECSFTTTFVNVMKSHVSKHINLFKCKYCEKAFSSPTQVSAHNAQEHPDLELKIESIQNYEALLEKIMTNVKWLKPTAGASTPEEKQVPESPKKNHAVAKKSTARPTVRPSLMPYKVKAVARKSTNPHSRFLASPRATERHHSPAKSRQFSYYGIPSSPINLSSLNTYMVVGGHRMKVNCTTLAQLINIDPKVVLRDLKHNMKNLAALKKSK
ncbi:uncharacterized protein LOC143376099 isoform X3 [Andrena cerasifolii]|uniref:uncharacterized protein LOC143376099 isoform X3 n=1 Tax=Andrena cerasifolii TaxID=2819439 RepID=UPI00403828FF